MRLTKLPRCLGKCLPPKFIEVSCPEKSILMPSLSPVVITETVVARRLSLDGCRLVASALLTGPLWKVILYHPLLSFIPTRGPCQRVLIGSYVPFVIIGLHWPSGRVQHANKHFSPLDQLILNDLMGMLLFLPRLVDK